MMTPCPDIHIYGSATAPERQRWIAMFFVPALPSAEQEARGLQPSERNLPMVFFHPTKEGARACAEVWWKVEQDKLASRETARASRKVAA